jgi:hypothetical protein
LQKKLKNDKIKTIMIRDGTTYRTDIEHVGCNAHIDIGGSGARYVPNLNCHRWDDEAWLNINYPVMITTERETFADDKIELEAGGVKQRWYEKNGLNVEWEIEFPSKPSTNIIEFDITFSSNLMFFYQDTLRNDWLADDMGMTWEEYNTACNRPENVVGSYAVYIGKKNNKYVTGKFCHIYRPKLIDAAMHETWCDLNINILTGKMTITIPERFLDDAIYPVILDPELGYTTAGASNYGNNAVKLSSHADTDGSGGTTSMYHCALSAVDATNNNAKIGVYDVNQTNGNPANEDLVEQAEYTSVTVSDDNQVAAGGASLSASTKYAIAWIPEDSDTKLKYDTGAANSGYYVTGRTYADELASNWGGSSSSNAWLISAWVTYSSGAASIDATCTDGFEISETVTGETELQGACSDGVEMSESVGANMELQGSCEDTAEISESITAETGIFGNCTDGVEISENVTGEMNFQAVCTDGFSMSEVVQGILELFGNCTDGMTLSENVQGFLELLGNCTDGVVLGDVTSTRGIIDVTCTDGFIISDSPNAQMTLNVIVSDGAVFSEILTAIKEMFGNVSDGFEISDVTSTEAIITVGNITMVLSLVEKKIELSTIDIRIDIDIP